MIWWPRKTNETNHFKVKTWGEFGLTILKVKKIHYKRIEIFTIRFNPKSIAILCSNLLTRPRANSESTNSFSPWTYCNISTYTCDFEIPLKVFRLSSIMICSSNFYNIGSWDSTRNIVCVEDCREVWVQNPRFTIGGIRCTLFSLKTPSRVSL